MIISLKSDNPNLSWVIKKNPSSIPKGAKIRQGVSLGWFHNDAYHCMFLECIRSTSSLSFSAADFEYIYDGEYAHSFAALSLIFEYFKDSIYKANEKDIVAKQVLRITSLRVPPKYEKFKNFFASLKYTVVEECQVWPDYKVIEFEMNSTLSDFLANVSVCLLLLLLLESEKGVVYVDEKMKTKYIDLINQVNANYFVRYMFKLRLGNSKKSIDALSTSTIKLVQGNNHDNRIAFVNQFLTAKDTVLEVGCGEGALIKKIAPKVQRYVGVDIDDDILDIAKRQIKYKELLNAIACKPEEILDTEFDVLVLTEVLEHLESRQEATNLICHYINLYQPKKIILTTPNFEFNYNYQLDGFRHEDHKFELTTAEFIAFVDTLNVQNAYMTATYYIGDIVDGIHCTHGALLSQPFNKNKEFISDGACY